MDPKPWWIWHVLEAASRLIKILCYSSKVTPHGTCPFSASSLSANLDIVACILCKLYLRCGTSSWLNRVTCLRNWRLRGLLFMTWVLLKVDTFKVTDSLIILPWSHLHLSNITEAQIALFKILLNFSFLVWKVEIELFESDTTTLLLVLCCCPTPDHDLGLISQRELQLILHCNLLLPLRIIPRW